MTLQSSSNFVTRLLFSAFVFVAMASMVPAATGDDGKEAAKNSQETEAADDAAASESDSKKESPEESPEPDPKAGTNEKNEATTAVDPDDAMAAENADAEQAAVARPVSPDLVQVFGWREYILINGVEGKLKAKLDSGALTSSIHAEEIELFERDGKKWVRFIMADPTVKKPARTRIEAPFVRLARVKEPGSESVAREVVRLSFQIGDRKMRGEFTLNNRKNMLAPVLLGRSIIKDLGWVDAGRTHLADQKIFR